MIKVLIVDDEELLRKGLLALVDWNFYGFEIVGEASNGAEALQFMENHEVHVIITDIRMPVMDGIKLMEEVQARFPFCKIIVVSGYDDFNYAKAAIECGAVSYILKPMEEEDIIRVLEKTKKEFEKNVAEIINNKGIEFYKSVSGNKLFEDIKQYINDNYSAKLSLEDISEKFFISKSHLCKLFKDETGMTFKNYLNKIRVEKAKELLRNSYDKVYEICYKLGFEDCSYFVKLFKEMTGVTPMEFRNL